VGREEDPEIGGREGGRTLEISYSASLTGLGVLHKV